MSASQPLGTRLLPLASPARTLAKWGHALVAGGRCAGPPSKGISNDVAFAVSMPLLRAVDVRVRLIRFAALVLGLSQCPCCGRSMCGGLCKPRRVDPSDHCLNALVAGGRCAGTQSERERRG